MGYSVLFITLLLFVLFSNPLKAIEKPDVSQLQSLMNLRNGIPHFFAEDGIQIGHIVADSPSDGVLKEGMVNYVKCC